MSSMTDFPVYVLKNNDNDYENYVLDRTNENSVEVSEMLYRYNLLCFFVEGFEEKHPLVVSNVDPIHQSKIYEEMYVLEYYGLIKDKVYTLFKEICRPKDNETMVISSMDYDYSNPSLVILKLCRMINIGLNNDVEDYYGGFNYLFTYDFFYVWRDYLLNKAMLGMPKMLDVLVRSVYMRLGMTM